MNWTREQMLAIEEQGNLIVSAAAGAGKTAVLTERVVRLVEKGADIESLLILTFTRAAAAEMKERIESALQDRAQKATEKALQDRLYHQSLRCANANISTIHAFCARVVNRYFHLVGLSPSAATLDETESAVLLRESMEEALTNLATEDAPAYRVLIRAFEGEAALEEALMGLNSFLKAQPEPEKWLSDAEENLTSRALFDKGVEVCFREDKARFEAVLSDLVRQRDSLPPQRADVISYLDETIPHAQGALLQQTPQGYAQALTAVVFGRMPAAKGMDPELKDALTAARDKVKKEARDQAAAYGQDLQQQWLLHLQSARVLTVLISLWRQMEALYALKKRDRDKLDFNDLEHYCARILDDETAAAEYRERFSAIIVDEYQDSNAVQEAILNKIRRADNLFFVGDVKQSIYGFRMAEPGLFLEKLKTFCGAAGKRIDLNHNFRSSQEVLTAVNQVFEKLMGPGISPIVYDEQAALRPGCPQPEGQAELHLIERAYEEDSEEEPIDVAEAEARFCAQRIKDMMAKETYQDGADSEPRPLRFSDFAILLRNMTHARIFARTLALSGIPCYAQLSGGYFESVEVMVALNLLRVIDNRRQDIPLLSVLHSSVGGFSHGELMALRNHCPNGDILDCLTFAAGRDPDGKAAGFLNKIAAWRQQSRISPVETILVSLLDETGLYEEMGAMPGGIQRQANLDALVSKAHSYDDMGGFGLHGFIAYMDQAKASAKSGAAQTVQSDVVRILTVHKSKGLEFPVVFLAQMNGQFSRQGERAALLLHRELGLGLTFVDPEGTKREPIFRRGILLLNRRQQLEEEMRVLYVAMTRPKRQLILVGTLKDARSALNTPLHLTPYGLLSARSFLRWVLLCAPQQVKTFVHPREEFAISEGTERPPLAPGDPLLVEALVRKYAFVYPYAGAAGVPNKTSVTALAERHTLSFTEPAFAPEQGALRRGTDVHSLLQHLPLEPLSPAALAAYLQEQNGEAYRRGIEYFVGTDLFLRMCQSPTVYRELPFTLSMDSHDLLGTNTHERVLLQGVMDACFLEEGGFVLLDYKTDHVTGDPAAFAQRHLRQVELYAQALATLTGQPVKERWLVFINGRSCVRL